MGWYLDEANLAQVSLNLLDYHQASMHTAFEECVKDAKVRRLKLQASCVEECSKFWNEAKLFDSHFTCNMLW